MNIISTGNAPIKALGVDVVLTYVRSNAEVADDGVNYADEVETSFSSRAMIKPGVPETLRAEVAGDRWDDYFSFWVDADLASSINGRDVNLRRISRGSDSYKVTTIRDWGESFMCIGERAE